ncbi:MAG TPA: hypothetical protein VH418_20875 [Solirubrobacteraceae bacterium]|jgi:hypothetical protein
MINARVDTSTGLDGEPVVLACFDLDGPDVAAVAHAVKAVAAERYRLPSLSTDDVLELRELTALADELSSLTALAEGYRTVVMRPARLTACRDALGAYVELRDEAEWLRDEDREPLARVRPLLPALEDLCADALRAALAAREPTA